MALAFLQVLFGSDHENELSIAYNSTSDGQEVLDHQGQLELDMATLEVRELAKLHSDPESGSVYNFLRQPFAQFHDLGLYTFSCRRRSHLEGRY